MLSQQSISAPRAGSSPPTEGELPQKLIAEVPGGSKKRGVKKGQTINNNKTKADWHQTCVAFKAWEKDGTEEKKTKAEFLRSAASGPLFSGTKTEQQCFGRHLKEFEKGDLKPSAKKRNCPKQLSEDEYVADGSIAFNRATEAFRNMPGHADALIPAVGVHDARTCEKTHSESVILRSEACRETNDILLFNECAVVYANAATLPRDNLSRHAQSGKISEPPSDTTGKVAGATHPRKIPKSLLSMSLALHDDQIPPPIEGRWNCSVDQDDRTDSTLRTRELSKKSWDSSEDMRDRLSQMSAAAMDASTIQGDPAESNLTRLIQMSDASSDPSSEMLKLSIKDTKRDGYPTEVDSMAAFSLSTQSSISFDCARELVDEDTIAQSHDNLQGDYHEHLSAEVQFRLGVDYLHGSNGCIKNYAVALDCFNKAAQLGHDTAHHIVYYFFLEE